MLLPEVGEVITPIDDPCQFDPAWRSIVATYLFSAGLSSRKDLEQLSKTGGVQAISGPPKYAKRSGKKEAKRPKAPQARLRPLEPFASEPRYRGLVLDKWMSAYLEMCTTEAMGRPVPDEHLPMKLARRWHLEGDCEWAMRKRLEPLLLTGVGMDVITLDLIGVPGALPAVEAYEKMYFNCRGEKGDLHPSMQLVQRFATPFGPLRTYLRKGEHVDEDGFIIGDGRPLAKDSDVWKAIASTMGYEALMYLWGWEKRAHGLEDKSLQKMIELSWKASVSRLLSDLYTGSIAHEDAARVLASYTSQAKFMSDEKRGGGNGEVNDTTTALMNILYLAAPNMVQFDEADESARNDEIQSRIASQLAINKQAIEDRGKQVEAEIIDAQISAAVKQ